MSLLTDFSFAVVVTDPRQTDNPIVFASRAFYELTGYTAAEVLGYNCRFLQGPDTERRHAMEIRDALREERSCQVCLTNYKRNGEKFWNQLYIEPVFDDNHQVSRYVGIQTDVTALLQPGCSINQVKSKEDLVSVLQTEREHAFEVSKRVSESQDQSLVKKEAVSVLPSSILASLERIQQSFVLVDPHLPDMPIVHAGDTFVKLTGYPRHEIIGRNCRFLQGPLTDQSEVERIRKAITASPAQPVSATLLNYKYDGTPFWNALHIAPVRGSDGEVVYFVGVQLNANEEKTIVQVPEAMNAQSMTDNRRDANEGVQIPQCGNIGFKHRLFHNGTIGEVRVAIRSLSGSNRGLRRSLSNCRLPESENATQMNEKQ